MSCIRRNRKFYRAINEIFINNSNNNNAAQLLCILQVTLFYISLNAIVLLVFYSASTEHGIDFFFIQKHICQFFCCSLKARLHVQAHDVKSAVFYFSVGFMLNRIKQNGIKRKKQRWIEGSVVYPLLSTGDIPTKCTRARVCCLLCNTCVCVCIRRHGK